MNLPRIPPLFSRSAKFAVVRATLEQFGIQNLVSLDANPTKGQTGLSESNGEWEVSVANEGGCIPLGKFANEQNAAEFLMMLLMRNSPQTSYPKIDWGRVHESTSRHDRMRALHDELRSLGVDVDMFAVGDELVDDRLQLTERDGEWLMLSVERGREVPLARFRTMEDAGDYFAVYLHRLAHLFGGAPDSRFRVPSVDWSRLDQYS